MLKIRLARIGKKKQPTFRLIISEHTKDTYGNYLEKLGHYDPRKKAIELDKERIAYWISKGAQMTDTVHNLLVQHGIIEGKKVGVTTLTKKRREKIESAKPKAEEPEKPAESAAEEPKNEEQKA